MKISNASKIVQINISFIIMIMYNYGICFRPAFVVKAAEKKVIKDENMKRDARNHVVDIYCLVRL